MNISTKHTTCYLTATVLLGSSAICQAAYVVYAVDSSTDSLYTVNLSTGNTSIIGSLHPDADRYMTPVAMAIRPGDGTIFINNNSPESDDGLSTVDAVTGLATFIGGGSYIDGALAFDAKNNLYAADANSALAIINQTDGSSTPLGGPPLPRLFGLDYNVADGFLYGITGSVPALELLKIDPATGNLVATVGLNSIQPLSGSTAGTLMFDWLGMLWGTTNGDTKNLFQINPITGTVIHYRDVTTGFVPQGMGYINTIPVPAAVWLFGSGLIGLIGIARRKAA